MIEFFSENFNQEEWIELCKNLTTGDEIFYGLSKRTISSVNETNEQIHLVGKKHGGRKIVNMCNVHNIYISP